MSTKELKNNNEKLFNAGLEKYPFSTVIIENALILSWILSGSYLCKLFLPVLGWVYLVFGMSMVLVVMRILVCKNCYYHGKMCHTGWGKLSALYCKQGEITRFGCGFTGKMIPLFYASMTFIPIIFGVVSIVMNFSFLSMSVLVVFLGVAMLSSFTFRKKACGQCKMKIICQGSLAK